MAKQVAEVFTEVIIAPGYDDAALEVLTTRKNLRVLRCPPRSTGPSWELRPLGPDLLMQDADHFGTPGDDPGQWELKAGQPVTADTLADLGFAWRACRSVKSNAILLAVGGATVGVGMGQVNRVDAAKLAVTRAGDRAQGAVGASDAYFPFPDGFQVLADAGVRAVVEPGGSIRDDVVAEAAEAAGVSLYFTGTRHFFH
jgi:phosphoribosylaminoimidazolecarboxamide formyltransferase/IMP cyclohydrolase